MKIPTYKTVFDKVYNKKRLNALEKFIADYAPKSEDPDEVKNFMRKLQKAVDVVNHENACDWESQ
jgi:hypothetical protein